MKSSFNKIHHFINVKGWELSVHKESKAIAKALGVKLNSADFQLIKHDVANGIIRKEDLLTGKTNGGNQ